MPSNTTRDQICQKETYHAFMKCSKKIFTFTKMSAWESISFYHPAHPDDDLHLASPNRTRCNPSAKSRPIKFYSVLEMMSSLMSQIREMAWQKNHQRTARGKKSCQNRRWVKTLYGRNAELSWGKVWVSSDWGAQVVVILVFNFTFIFIFLGWRRSYSSSESDASATLCGRLLRLVY